MKCERCGKGIGIVRRGQALADGYICYQCLDELGFDKAGRGAKRWTYTYDQIKNGKAALFSRPAVKKNLEEYKAHGISYENEDGHSIQKILSAYVKDEYEDDKLSNAEIKEELEYEDKVYVYPSMDIRVILEPTEFDGEPAVKIMGETSPLTYTHIGWIPKRDAAHVIEIMNNHDYEVTAELVGGPYKYRDEDDKIRVASTEFGCRVYLAY